jgi:hypothetical protein
MYRRILLFLFVCLASTASAAVLKDGITLVDGKPFYPLGSWPAEGITAEGIASLGMNATFRMGSRSPKGIAEIREFMRECDRYGIQVMIYVPHGRHREGAEQWPREAVKHLSVLAKEPNLLAWNVGDDIYIPALEDIRKTVKLLREYAPGIPTIADCGPKVGRSGEGKLTFDNFVDITMNYDYPIPDDDFIRPGNRYRQHMAFFDEMREVYGEPLWTWMQTYQWHWTSRKLQTSPEVTGPYPSPEQLRLLAMSEIGRGLRGLFAFCHRKILLQPETAAAVGITFREIKLFNDILAVGKWTGHLTVSDPDADAASHEREGSTLVSVGLYRDHYQRWVDEAVVENLVITAPWKGKKLPKALHVATPDVVECTVSPASPGSVKVTIPRLEVAGFVLLTQSWREARRLKKGVAAIPKQVRTLIHAGAVARTQSAANVLYTSGSFRASRIALPLKAANATRRLATELDSRDYAPAMTAYNDALRLSRVMIDSAIRSAKRRAPDLLPEEREHLRTPWGLRLIPGLVNAPPMGDRWHFARLWQIAGPFSLEMAKRDTANIPVAFNTPFPPETAGPGTLFETVDGRTMWQSAEAKLTGLLDFIPLHKTTRNVVVYARCRVVAPDTMTARFSFSSNDGAKVFVNGKDVYGFGAPIGRKARTPHDDGFTAHLNKGPNTILVKVTNYGANWRMFLSVDDPERKLMFDRNW